ncbi:MAG: 2-phospho-L-lactate guanylyltransferase [Ornithinibacter sp.]
MPSPDLVATAYAVLVPVKPPAIGKSRLGDLGDGPRRDLAHAFAADTVSAVLSCDLVARVLVVTDDHLLARALSELGADVIPDGTTDLNGTLAQAAAEMHRRDPLLRLAAVCADLPALRPDELASALRASDPGRMSFVADQERVGTTAVFAPTIASFRPAFGSGSRREHLEAGAHEIDGVDVPTLRRDVDDPDDLSEALSLGVGRRTTQVAEALRLRTPLAGVVRDVLQATVFTFDESTRAGSVLLDDGAELPFASNALTGSGLRLLRPGQRVRLDTDDGQVTRLQILTLH